MKAPRLLVHVMCSFLVINLVSNLDANAQEEIVGCTYPMACNYDPLATVHIDVCDFESCAGCVYIEASNWDPDATLNDGSCIFLPHPDCADANGDHYNDTNDLLTLLAAFAGSCDWDDFIVEIPCDTWVPATDQCNIPMACNYNPDATFDDGSCIFNDCSGCNQPSVDNYEPCARNDYGYCMFSVIPPTQPTSITCRSDFNRDGEVNTSDILIFLSKFGLFCSTNI